MVQTMSETDALTLKVGDIIYDRDNYGIEIVNKENGLLHLKMWLKIAKRYVDIYSTYESVMTLYTLHRRDVLDNHQYMT